MSEYQYYEFQALDRRLTPEEMAELRQISTRAQITPTRFQNVYNYGDFRGNPVELMKGYFDAFLYLANWGTHQLMLRLPAAVLDLDLVRRYASQLTLERHQAGKDIILEFTAGEEGGDFEWMVDKDSAAWLPALIPLREDLSNGDLRALYISWLSFVATQWYPREDEDLVEPPVPPGLGALTPTLKALAEFVYVDEDLLAVAAERSRPLPASKQSAVDMLRWIVELTADEKDDIVLRLMTGEAPPLRAELLHRYRQATASPLPLTEGTRQASEIIAAAEAHREERERAERARQAAGRERRERENAAARERHLDRITGTEAELWRQVETLIEVKRPKEYDQAVSLLADLRDLAARQSQTRAFRDRITDLRRRYPTRRGLLQRLDRARLGA